MQRIVSYTNSLLSAVTGWLMILMMGILVGDVIWRTFAQPLLGMAEMSVFVMMIVIYLGFSRCEEFGDHVRLEFLVDIAKGRIRHGMVLIARLLAVLTVASLSYAVATDAWTSYLTNDSIEGMINLPIWPTKFIMVIGMTLFFLQTLLNLFKPLDPPQADRAFSESGTGT
ncbi:TRAP transporter small permease [Leisingera daeponensis]|uniref:TRAP transporter small permease n=1 Tax=Leisingera daeponensis TaxID=405746 RepID=UPI001C96EF88|nr:TRAP transporter small permease [Leisingera daeponensis]MBY6059614.1 TRAP transporter small permease subunit [Leisingera daeponensis]